MMSMPALHRAMTVVAGTVAGLPATDAAGVPLGESDTPAGRLWRSPAPERTAWQWLDEMMWSMMIHGAAVVVPLSVDSRGDVDLVQTVHPELVSPLWPRQSAGWAGAIRIDSQVLEWGDYLLVCESTLPGWLWPPSRLRLMAAAIGIMLSEQQHVASIYSDGAQPTGMWVSGSPLDPDVADELAGKLAAAVGGRGDGITVLPADLSWQSPQLSHADLQLLEARQWSTAQAATMLGVPAHLIGAATYDAETYASARMDLQVFELLTIARYARAIEGQLARWGLDVRLGSPGLTEPTMTERIQSMTQAVAAGICSPAQAAARLGWDPPDTDRAAGRDTAAAPGEDGGGL